MTERIVGHGAGANRAAAKYRPQPLENVRVHNRGTQIAFAKEAELALELLPLFRRALRYGNIALNGARISIERGPVVLGTLR